MQKQPESPAHKQSKWGAVLLALHRAGKFVALEELTKLSELEEPDVMNSLTFLVGQGWVYCLPDGSCWACTPQSHAIMESLGKSFARAV